MASLHIAQRVLNRLRAPAPRAPAPPVETVIADLPEPYRGMLLSMYRGEAQLGVDGRLHELDATTKVLPDRGMGLYGWALEATRTCEIGMAYGFSTLFMLAAGKPHTAIDPHQDTSWHGIGRVAAGGRCRLLLERSDRAAVDLARAGESFDLIFIDGDHLFDGVMLDFHQFAPLCPIGGRIVFDDMWMPSVRTAVAFVKSDRADFAYEPTPHLSNVASFRRVAEDRRRWDHFVPFIDE